MELAASLHINTVRVFIENWMRRSKSGNEWAPEDLQKFDDFLGIANKNGIVVIPSSLQIADSSTSDSEREVKRSLNRSLIERHANDERILMWDIINEPTGGKPTCDTHNLAPLDQACVNPLLVNIAQVMNDVKRSANAWDPNHFIYVGATHNTNACLKRANALGDIVAFHEYGIDSILSEGSSRVQWSINTTHSLSTDKLVLIGEFGMPTVNSEGFPRRTEEDQWQLFNYVLDACEKERQKVAGVMPWMLLDVVNDNIVDSNFGIVRADRTLKPAGALLRDTFYRWAQSGKNAFFLPSITHAPGQVTSVFFATGRRFKAGEHMIEVRNFPASVTVLNAWVTEAEADLRGPKIGDAVFKTLSVQYSTANGVCRIIFSHDFGGSIPVGLMLLLASG